MRKNGNGLNVGRSGSMEVKAPKGNEADKKTTPNKQKKNDLRAK